MRWASDAFVHWQDTRPREMRAPWSALTFVVECGDLPAMAPGFRVRVARGGLLRIECSPVGEPVLWARIEPRGAGFAWLAGPGFASSVPPLRAAESREAPVRKHDASAWYAFWSRRFVLAMMGSEHAPLHPGTWQLRPCEVRADAPAYRAIVSPESGLPFVYDVGGVLDQPRSGREPWRSNGSRALFTLRGPSPAGSSRVKAWRKFARDGSLPPVLVALITGLDAFVVIDGHDRLHAALAEGTLPSMLALSHVRYEPGQIDVQRAESVLRSAWLALDSPRRRPGTLARVNAAVLAAHDDAPQPLERTRAWPLAGGAARWHAEVRAQGHESISGP